jgi:hypothetical protein
VLYIGDSGRVCIDVISTAPQYLKNHKLKPHTDRVLHAMNVYTRVDLEIPFENILQAYSQLNKDIEFKFAPGDNTTEMSRHYYQSKLAQHICEVSFYKKDNSVRKMVCTLDPGIISEIVGEPRSLNLGPSEQSVELIRVMDVELSWWRTINITKLISFVVTDKTYQPQKQITTRDV